MTYKIVIVYRINGGMNSSKEYFPESCSNLVQRHTLTCFYFSFFMEGYVLIKDLLEISSGRDFFLAVLVCRDRAGSASQSGRWSRPATRAAHNSRGAGFHEEGRRPASGPGG